MITKTLNDYRNLNEDIEDNEDNEAKRSQQINPREHGVHYLK